MSARVLLLAATLTAACSPAGDSDARRQLLSSILRLDGTPHPDLSGVWQALNEANWDLEGHAARPAAALQPGVREGSLVPKASVLALGARGGVHGSLGIVEGGTIPYRPETLVRRNENAVGGTYQSAYQIFQNPKYVVLLAEVRQRAARHPARRTTARSPSPVDGRCAGALGRRYPRRRDDHLPRRATDLARGGRYDGTGSLVARQETCGSSSGTGALRGGLAAIANHIDPDGALGTADRRELVNDAAPAASSAATRSSLRRPRSRGRTAGG